MFENIIKFFKNIGNKEGKKQSQESSKNAAKERLHLVLMQDRANVSADFLELMKQEIIDVIKKYIDIDEKEIDVRLTNKENEDGTNGAPALYANIPILNIKNDSRKISKKDVEEKKEVKKESKREDKKEAKQDDKKEKVKQEKNKKEEVKQGETEKQNKEKTDIKEIKEEEKKEAEAQEKVQEIIEEVIEKVEEKEEIKSEN